MVLLNIYFLLMISTIINSDSKELESCEFAESFYDVNWLEKYENFPISNLFWFNRFLPHSKTIESTLYEGDNQTSKRYNEVCKSVETLSNSTTVYEYLNSGEKKNYCVLFVFDDVRKNALVKKIEVPMDDVNKCTIKLKLSNSVTDYEMYWMISFETRNGGKELERVTCPIQGNYQLTVILDNLECSNVDDANSSLAALSSTLKISACEGIARSNKYKNRHLLSSTLDCLSYVSFKGADVAADVHAENYLLLHLSGALFCARYKTLSDGTILLAINVDEKYSAKAWCGTRYIDQMWRQQWLVLALAPIRNKIDNFDPISITNKRAKSDSMEHVTSNSLSDKSVSEHVFTLPPNPVSIRNKSDKTAEPSIVEYLTSNVQSDKSISKGNSIESTNAKNPPSTNDLTDSNFEYSSGDNSNILPSKTTSLVSEDDLVSMTTPKNRNSRGDATNGTYADERNTTSLKPTISSVCQFPNLLFNSFDCFADIYGSLKQIATKMLYMILALLFVCILIAILCLVFANRRTTRRINSRMTSTNFGDLKVDEQLAWIEDRRSNTEGLRLVESTIPWKTNRSDL